MPGGAMKNVPLELSGFLLVVLLAAGCEKSGPTTPGRTALDFVLRVGQSQILPVEGVELGFERVTADSRCPASVQCVIAGAAGSRLWLWKAGRDSVFIDLTVPSATEFGPSSAKAFGFRISAIELAPYAIVPGTIPQSEYRLTLKVERARH
jgi:hypothetical protein